MPNDLQRWAAVQLQRIRESEGEVPYLTALERARRDPSYTQELAGVAEHGKLMQGGWGLADIGLAGAGMGAAALGIPGVQVPVGIGLAGLGAARMHEAYKRKQEDLPWKMEMGIGALDPLMLGWQGYKALKKPLQAAMPSLDEPFKAADLGSPLQGLQEKVAAGMGSEGATLDPNLLRPLPAIRRTEGGKTIFRAGQPIDPRKIDLSVGQQPGRYDLGRTGRGMGQLDAAPLPGSVDQKLRKDVGGAFPDTTLKKGEVKYGSKFPSQTDDDFLRGTPGLGADPMMSPGVGGARRLGEFQEAWKNQYAHIPDGILSAREHWRRVGTQTARGLGKMTSDHPYNQARARLANEIDKYYVWDPDYKFPKAPMGPKGQEPPEIPDGAWRSRQTGEVWRDPDRRLSGVDAAKSGPHEWSFLDPASARPQVQPSIYDQPPGAGSASQAAAGAPAPSGVPAATVAGVPAGARQASLFGQGQEIAGDALGPTQQALPGVDPRGLPVQPGAQRFRKQPPGDFEGRGGRGQRVESPLGRWEGGPGESTPYMPGRVQHRQTSEAAVKRIQRDIDRDIKAVNKVQAEIDLLEAAGETATELPKAALARIPILLSRLQENVGRLQMLDDVPANQKYKAWLEARGMKVNFRGPTGAQQPLIEGKLLKQGELPFTLKEGPHPPWMTSYRGAASFFDEDAIQSVQIRGINTRGEQVSGPVKLLANMETDQLETYILNQEKYLSSLTDPKQLDVAKQELAAAKNLLESRSTGGQPRPFDLSGENSLPHSEARAPNLPPEAPTTAGGSPLRDADLNNLANQEIETISRERQGYKAAPHKARALDTARQGRRVEFYARLIQRHMFDPMLATFLTKRGGTELMEAYGRLGEAGTLAPDSTKALERMPAFVKTTEGKKWFQDHYQNFVGRLQDTRTLREIIRRTLIPYTPEGRALWTEILGDARQGAEFFRTPGMRGSALRRPGVDRSGRRRVGGTPKENLPEDLLRETTEMDQQYANLTGSPYDNDLTDLPAPALGDQSPELVDDFDRLVSAFASENMEVFHPSLATTSHYQALFPGQKAWLLDQLSAYKVADLGGGINEDMILARLQAILNEPVSGLSTRIGKEVQAQQKLAQTYRQKAYATGTRTTVLDDSVSPAGIYPEGAPQSYAGRPAAEINKAYQNALAEAKAVRGRGLDKIEQAISKLASQRTLDTTGREAPGAAGILRYLDTLDIGDANTFDALFSNMEQVLERLTGVARAQLDTMDPTTVGKTIQEAIRQGQLKGTDLALWSLPKMKQAQSLPPIPYDQMGAVYANAVRRAKQPAVVGKGQRAHVAAGKVPLEQPKTDPVAARRLAILLLARQSGLSNNALAKLTVGDFIAHTLGPENAIVARGVVRVLGREKGRAPVLQGSGDYFLNNDTHDAILLMLGNRYGWKRSRGGAPTRQTHRLQLSGENNNDPLFATTAGEQLKPERFTKDITDLVADTYQGHPNPPKWERPFQSGFRRWAVDHAGSPDMSVKERQELGRLILGHADTSMVKKYYANKGSTGVSYAHGLNASAVDEEGIKFLREQEGGVPDPIVAYADEFLDTYQAPPGGWTQAREAEAQQVAAQWKMSGQPLTDFVGDQPVLTTPLLTHAEDFSSLLPLGARAQRLLGGLPTDMPTGEGGMAMFRGEHDVMRSMKEDLYARLRQEIPETVDLFRGVDPNDPVAVTALARKQLENAGINPDTGMITLPDGVRIRGGIPGTSMAAAPEGSRFPQVIRDTDAQGRPGLRWWDEGAKWNWAEPDKAQRFFTDLDAGLRRVDKAVLQEPVYKITETFAAIQAKTQMTEKEKVLFESAVRAFWSPAGRNVRNMVLDTLVLGDELARTGRAFGEIYAEALTRPGGAAIRGASREAGTLRTLDTAAGARGVAQGFNPAVAEARMEGINMVEDYVRAVMGKVSADVPLRGQKASSNLLKQGFHFGGAGLPHTLFNEPYLFHSMGVARERRLVMRMEPLPGKGGRTPLRKDNYSAIRRLLYSIVPMVVLPHAAAEYLGVRVEES